MNQDESDNYKAPSNLKVVNESVDSSACRQP